MPLTNVEILAAKSREKAFKLSDGGGLFLLVNPTGSKLWRMAYRFAGKEKLLSIGAFPAVSLLAARVAREAAKARIKAGVDPSAQKRLDKLATVQAAANTFEAIARELLDKKRREGKAETTLGKLDWLLGLALPALGLRPITEITAPEVLMALRKVEARGKLETAHRHRALIGEVFRYAVATGRTESDPTGALRGALASPVVKHRPAIIEPRAFGGLLRAISAYEGMPETQAALGLIPLTFARPGELRSAEWSAIDFEAAVWVIPAEKMKMRRPHRIPLSSQSLAILRSLHAMTGDGKFLFPSVRTPTRCMSENTINAALRRMGIRKDEMCGHGFRSSASSILNESGIWNADAVEAQLSHIENNAVRRAYARADYWDERVRMMAWWADKCDELRRGGEVVQFKAG